VDGPLITPANTEATRGVPAVEVSPGSDAPSDAGSTADLAWGYAVQAEQKAARAEVVKAEGSPCSWVVGRYKQVLVCAERALELLGETPREAKWDAFVAKIQHWRVRLAEEQELCHGENALDNTTDGEARPPSQVTETAWGSVRVTDEQGRTRDLNEDWYGGGWDPR